MSKQIVSSAVPMLLLLLAVCQLLQAQRIPAPEMELELEPEASQRYRRQVSIPQQQQQQPANGGGLMGFLNNLQPQLDQAKAFTSFFQQPQQQQQQQQPTSGFGSGNLMNQLSDLIRSTQDRNARVVESSQQNANQALGQMTAATAQTAQTGIQAALMELGQGLQRMALNNPNLVPEIKNLYQSVASRLSSATSAVAPTGAGQQLGSDLSKAIANPVL